MIPPTPKPALGRRLIALVRRRPLLFLGVVYGLVNLGFVLTRHGDFLVYYASAVRFLEGAEIYVAEPHRFTYPPFAALAIVPLAWFGLDLAKIMFFVLSFAAMVWGIRTVHRNLAIEHVPYQPIVFALTGLLSFRFIQSAFNNQQTDLIVFALVAAGATALVQAHRGAVYWWGVAAALKANPLFMVLIPFFRGSWRWSVMMVVVFALLLLLPDAFKYVTPAAANRTELVLSQTIVPRERYREPRVYALKPAAKDPLHYIHSFVETTFSSGGNSWWTERDNPLNQSLTRILSRPFNAAANWVFLALCAGLALLLWCGRRIGRADPFLYAFLFYCAFVLIGPVSSKPHFVAFYGLLLFAWQDLFIRFHWLRLGILMPASAVFGLTSAGMLSGLAYDIGTIGHIGISGFVLWCYAYTRAWILAGSEQLNTGHGDR